GTPPAVPVPPQPASSAQQPTPGTANDLNGSRKPEDEPAEAQALPGVEAQPAAQEGHGPAYEEVQIEMAEPYIAPSMLPGPLSSGPLGQSTEAVLAQAAREMPDRPLDREKASALYKSGLDALDQGVRRGYTGMEVEPGAATAGAGYFREALQLVPNSTVYRYMHAVALRYSEGFEVAIGEFRQVLELDPGHFEARQQVAFGPRWHDPYAYPVWSERAVEPSMPLPEPVRTLLPQPHRPGTRLVLLREGNSKVVVALSRTRRDTWSELPTADMLARIEMVLTRTPSGPIIAFYVVIRDDPNNPYKGETFLNPHDPGQPSDDACQLGQHMLAQLARQDHTYLVFVDERDSLLLSRRLVFDTSTQVNIARIHYEAQSLPPQVMDAARFQQAAQWHMEHFSLDQIKS
ncbi:MAG: tetratricopeptide repeat protein, partial [Chloroflexia bacterium]